MATITVGEKRNIFEHNSFTYGERAKEIELQEAIETELIKREKSSPFSRWSQFNLEHTKELMWLALKHPKAHAILYFLVDQMDNLNAVMCSYQVLQEVMEVSGETIRKSIKVLKDSGFIAVLKSGTSNVYAINDSVYWKSWGNKKQYSKFPTSIILSLSEQEEGLQKKIESIKHKEVLTKSKN